MVILTHLFYGNFCCREMLQIYFEMYFMKLVYAIFGHIEFFIVCNQNILLLTCEYSRQLEELV
jgi:hypothetical protein